MIRSVAFPIIIGSPALAVIGWMVAPHVTQAGRNLQDSRSGRLTRDAIAELREWRRRRRNPGRVAAFGRHPHEDESLWLTTVPLDHLRRLTGTLSRMRRRARLRGENITRTRVVRQELRRRLRAADSPNRAVMDQLSDDELGFIRQQLNADMTDHEPQTNLDSLAQWAAGDGVVFDETGLRIVCHRPNSERRDRRLAERVARLLLNEPAPPPDAERLYEVIADALTQSGASHVLGGDVARARNAVLALWSAPLDEAIEVQP